MRVYGLIMCVSASF